MTHSLFYIKQLHTLLISLNTKHLKKNTPNKPYISEGSVRLGRKVEYLRKKYLKHNTCYNELRYRAAKSEHQKKVRQAQNFHINT